ncbi:MAG: tannase/feruloyl esterase family alpha/beta hydrolase [Burkholderiales bacterium]|nr:tannase/feruloyl esterase family alpha/beta hydrolase [Burkholderiales bacterium]
MPATGSNTTALALSAVLLAACVSPSPPAPLAAAQGSALVACEALAASFAFPRTSIGAAAAVPASELAAAGGAIGAHCRVVGAMNDRVSPVDGKRYAIGFEMRLPQAWNGRFFYQANGGVDGSVVPALGLTTPGPAAASALAKGFAVISSDAGHAAAQNGSFGIDPQARVDYGYGAVAALTPMAKALIRAAYGRAPDRSYIGGCSNGGRHALVAAARMPEAYDGFLVGDPGTVLPRAAIVNLVGGKTYASLASDPADVGSAFTLAERRLVSDAVLRRCDALDGATDGMVQDTRACQAAFDLGRDVPTCVGARDGSCLSAAQKAGIGGLFAGVAVASGARVYAPFPYDAGLATSDWAAWKFGAPSTRDAGAIAGIWQVPPAAPTGFDGRAFMLGADADALLARVGATDATYNEPALAFMLPPRLDDFSGVRRRGGRIVMYHGTSDPIFSSEHSVQVYEAWSRGSGGPADTFARLYLVPGMNHCRGGPSTDQFDLLQPLVEWVEQGKAPAAVMASVRGPGNGAGANADLPASWSPVRTRPLCPYPAVARRSGDGDLESASAFSCR